ncbi:hypothetical protein ACFX1Q_007580 [Malus domestica]
MVGFQHENKRHRAVHVCWTLKTKLTRPTRNDDGGIDYGRPLNKGVKIRLDEVTWTQAHGHMLVNTNAITPFQN